MFFIFPWRDRGKLFTTKCRSRSSDSSCGWLTQSLSFRGLFTSQVTWHCKCNLTPKTWILSFSCDYNTSKQVKIIWFSMKNKSCISVKKKKKIGVGSGMWNALSRWHITIMCKLKGQLALNRGSLWFLSTASGLNPQLPEVINMKLFPKISIDISCKQVMRIFTLIR